MAIRATRVIGPVAVSGDVTNLGGPAEGTRWKTESWFFYNPGVTSADVLLALGSIAADRLPIFKVPDIAPSRGAHVTFELVVNQADDLFLEVSTLDAVVVTVCAFVLDLDT